MIKEILWNHSASDISGMLNFRKQAPHGYSDEEFRKDLKNVREFISSETGEDFRNCFIFASGHQPELFHPGLLVKDVFASVLADRFGGKALHINVDTDESEFCFRYPVSQSHDKIIIKEQTSDCGKKIFHEGDLSLSEKEKLSENVFEALRMSRKILKGIVLSDTEKYLEYFLRNIHEKNIFSISREIEFNFLKDNGLKVSELSLFRLSETSEFRKFADRICADEESFRDAYNLSLSEYRKEHKIKNAAQPIPDLAKDEIPFWGFQSGYRKEIRNLSESSHIFPKALTLTLFLRIFVSDYFIHGTGGGRYERVNDSILKKYFRISLNDYGTATATMYLDAENFPLPQREEKDLLNSKRNFEQSPEKLLAQDHPLFTAKKALTEKFKNPETDKKLLHEEIQRLNIEIRKEVEPIYREILEELRILPELEENRRSVEKRDCPFFFYDVNELIRECRRRTEI